MRDDPSSCERISAWGWRRGVWGWWRCALGRRARRAPGVRPFRCGRQPSRREQMAGAVPRWHRRVGWPRSCAGRVATYTPCANSSTRTPPKVGVWWVGFAGRHDVAGPSVTRAAGSRGVVGSFRRATLTRHTPCDPARTNGVSRRYSRPSAAPASRTTSSSGDGTTPSITVSAPNSTATATTSPCAAHARRLVRAAGEHRLRSAGRGDRERPSTASGARASSRSPRRPSGSTRARSSSR